MLGLSLGMFNNKTNNMKRFELEKIEVLSSRVKLTCSIPINNDTTATTFESIVALVALGVSPNVIRQLFDIHLSEHEYTMCKDTFDKVALSIDELYFNLSKNRGYQNVKGLKHTFK